MNLYDLYDHDCMSSSFSMQHSIQKMASTSVQHFLLNLQTHRQTESIAYFMSSAACVGDRKKTSSVNIIASRCMEWASDCVCVGLEQHCQHAASAAHTRRVHVCPPRASSSTINERKYFSVDKRSATAGRFYADDSKLDGHRRRIDAAA